MLLLIFTPVALSSSIPFAPDQGKDYVTGNALKMAGDASSEDFADSAGIS